MRLPGTLSARIILGFAVLIITYGAISANTMYNMDRLSSEIRAVHAGYLAISRRTDKLAEVQWGLVEYLRDDLEKEVRVGRVSSKIRSALASRTKLMSEIDKMLAESGGLREIHQHNFAATAARLAQLRAHNAKAEAHYTDLLAAPPIDRPGAGADRIDPDHTPIARPVTPEEKKG